MKNVDPKSQMLQTISNKKIKFQNVLSNRNNTKLKCFKFNNESNIPLVHVPFSVLLQHVPCLLFPSKTGDQSQPKSTLNVRNYIVLLKWSVAVICSCAHDKESTRIAIFNDFHVVVLHRDFQSAIWFNSWHQTMLWHWFGTQIPAERLACVDQFLDKR